MNRSAGMLSLGVGIFNCSGAWAAPWTLEHPPVVPALAAPGSKQPADPKDFAEVKMDFPIAAGPFEPTGHPSAINIEWHQDAGELTLRCPAAMPCCHAVGFRVEF